MAEMEKITFRPLLQYLKDNAEALNRTLQLSGGSNNFDRHQAIEWCTQVIQPVFSAVHTHNAELAPKTAEILFHDMFRIFKTGLNAEKLQQAATCRLLLLIKPAITAPNPARALKKLDSALRHIRNFAPDAAFSWLELMQQAIPLCNSLDEVLVTGRIAAWRCGMAHLRLKLIIPADFNRNILSLIFAEKEIRIPRLLRPWLHDQQPVEAAISSFVGFEGNFSRPPLLTLQQNQVFASDGRTALAVFADRFGRTLYPCPESIAQGLIFAQKKPENLSATLAKVLKRYSDLTSWVCHDSTLFLTTENSHSIFAFGPINE